MFVRVNVVVEFEGIVSVGEVWKQKENETLRVYLCSLNELLKGTTKADPKAVPDPEKNLGTNLQTM